MTRKFTGRGSLFLTGMVTGFVLIGTIAQSWAGLTWEHDSIDLSPEAGVNVVRTEYAFTNNGTAAISVVDIKPSCGCVTTNLEKFEYAPGESGKIKVTFDAGMDKGDLEMDRTIKVTTSDAPGTPKVLQLRVRIPETVTATPEGLVWPAGKPGVEKEVVVKAGADVKDIKLNQVSKDANFPVVIKPEIEGQTYRLKIKPTSTGSPCYAHLVFNVSSPSFKHEVKCEVNVQVD